MYITVPDYRIEADDRVVDVIRSRPGAENEEHSILYRDEHGELHKIDLAACVVNYANERNIDPTSITCVGERDYIEGYFEFWTSGMKTRIVFPKRHFWESKRHRYQRFRSFQCLLNEMGYGTLDLT
jgi:hypothetical protein